MISVCMATRNGERYIREQLVSILRQLGSGDELVISDDSSTDRTVGIIEELSDERVRLFRDNNFFSPVYNFENALRKASGDILVLSDQDDVWLDDKISVVREGLAGKSGLVHTIMMDGIVIDEEGTIQAETLFERVNAGRGILKNIYDNCYTGCSMAFTRELLDVAIPFPPHIPMHDSWLGLLSELFGEMEFVARKTIQYRRHAANASYRRRNVLRQIGWRYFLAYHLLVRYVTHRMGRQAKGP